MNKKNLYFKNFTKNKQKYENKNTIRKKNLPTLRIIWVDNSNRFGANHLGFKSID